MSRVYKQKQVVLGEDQIVELDIRPVIKFDLANKADVILTDRTSEDVDDLAEEITEDPELIVSDAITKAEQVLADARLESEKILSDAQSEKELIISDAYAKFDEILESAKSEGYLEGFENGKTNGFNQVENIIQEAVDMKMETLAEKKKIAKELEGDMIELVIAAINKVIDCEIDKDHQLLLNLVRNGIEKCVYTDRLIIRVASNDYDVVNSSKNKIYLMTEGIDSIEVKEDPALKDGSIIIETASGTVEASIRTQIMQIEQMFYDILKGE